MNKVLMTGGALFFLFGAFMFGYVVGVQPTPEQEQNDQRAYAYIDDMHFLAQNSSLLFTLCEQKYQTALNGDLPGAARISGQIDAVNAQVNAIRAKYEVKAN